MDWSPFYGVVPFFLSTTLALVVAISYKTAKKRHARRSPLADKQVGHVPGQQLVARIADHEVEMVLAVSLMFMAGPAAFLLWVGPRVDWSKFRWGGWEWFYLACGAVIFGYGLWRYVHHLHHRDRSRDGLLAERVTGMQLNRLIARGCIVIHDLPGNGFNIDHVVIGPRGVYAVETKSRRKPNNASGDNRSAAHQVSYDGQSLLFPDGTTRKPIDQATQQAEWLSRWLREALNVDVPVTPAVALPGWYVIQSEDVWRTAAVKVFTPMGDGAGFMAKDAQKLDSSQRSLVATALAQRFARIES